MKIYLAARFSKHQEMQGVRDVLTALGHQVTSRWIDLHGGDQLESATHDQLNTNPNACSVYGIHDLEDIDAADVLVSFTYPDGGGKGGRHIEFGYGLASGKRMVLVGPRENIFHTLADVWHYADWSHFVMAVSMGLFSMEPADS